MHLSLLTTDIEHHTGWEEKLNGENPSNILLLFCFKTQPVHVTVPSLRIAPLFPLLPSRIYTEMSTI